MRVKFKINGIVQGVGFRPTLYKLAKKLAFKGYVLNSSDGVVLEIQKEKIDIQEFIKILKNNLPPLARIDEIEYEILEDDNFNDFYIKTSKCTTKTTSISPDIAVCDECLKEMFDKNNRRYLYPFINCTNCGPRYTIVQDIPYDRKNTSMNEFQMCKKCQKEYKNPENRRYHAEPISCYDCGPKLNKDIENIANQIKDGKIVAIKGLGGFHLICDATNEETLKTLRKRKNRPKKPFAMMFKNIETIKNYCEITEIDEELILSKEKPIVLVKKKKELKNIAPEIDKYGVFLPYTPIHYLLFEYFDFPIVATSANISNEPIIIDNKELKEKFENVVDDILDYDRKIVNGCDDSVIQSIKDKYITMRLSRGFAPFTFNIKKHIKPKILAVGANQKNTISLAFENKIILSPHIGDLGTIGSIEYFERTIETFRRLYSFEEDIIICDKHPYYESTKWAKVQNKKLVEIQHHYAHSLAGLFEFDLQKALIIAWDGTGYGDDGAIWGGEVFIANRSTYKRIHHFKYFKLIGAEKAIKNPANMAIGLLNDKLAKNYQNYKLAQVLKKGSFPLTSSVGRIFDIVAYLGGYIEKNEYEGYSGILIEKYYNFSIKESIDLKIEKEINFLPLIEFVAQNRGNFELISSDFLNSLANIIKKLQKKYHLPVIVTGGVFQNKTLLTLLDNVYFNQKIPINDGGISLGQVVWGVWNL